MTVQTLSAHSINKAMQLDFLADMGQCPCSYIVFAPDVQTGSLPFGLRFMVFVHTGSVSLMQPACTVPADLGSWSFVWLRSMMFVHDGRARLMQPACTVWAGAAFRSNVEWVGSVGASI